MIEKFLLFVTLVLLLFIIIVLKIKMKYKHDEKYLKMSEEWIEKNKLRKIKNQ